MKKKTISTIARSTIGIILLTMFVVSAVSGEYDLSWHTIDGGGGMSSGGTYTLTGTIAQHDAAYSAGEQYELLGGFWPGGPICICIVEFEDFARFADQWLYEGDGLEADLNGNGIVDYEDLDMFVEYWLYCCPYNWPW